MKPWSVRSWAIATLAILAWTVGCGSGEGDADDEGATKPSGGSAGSDDGSAPNAGMGGGARGGTSSSAGTGGVGTSGMSAVVGGGASGANGGSAAGGNNGENANGGTNAAGNGAMGGATVEMLPKGHRQYGRIVNLVSAEAVSQVESMLREEVDDVPGLPAAAREFYEYYLDEYDFLIVIGDHEVDGSTATAAFSPVYRPARAATGDRVTVDHRQSHNSARLKGVIGAQVLGGAPPLEHELAHYWAAHLDAQFGFGKDRAQNYGSHWGLTSVHGQLGGFDAASMECATPAGAKPPDCMAESNGRIRYTFDSFFPYVNRAVDYAPLELYLMGLLPAAEVPSRFMLLKDAAFGDVEVDSATKRVMLETGGTSDILFSDILRVHGEVTPLAAQERHFTAAFIVVSAAPASEEVLSLASEWQEIFGNHAPSTGLLQSFESRTGKRATLTTRLGRRRTASDPRPMPPAPQMCSVTAQDCADGLGCYGSAARQCAVAGTLARGAACMQNVECAPGLGCPNRLMACAPYCDPFDVAAPKACGTFCPNGFVQLVDSADVLVGGYCSPPP